jgi:5-methyltetrahydrofolate--homocysteine methyltransferase
LNPAGERLEALLRQRIVYLDGAMGTMIQQLKLQEADYRGERFQDHPGQLKGNNDLLVITKPSVVRDIHRAYLDAGADIARDEHLQRHVHRDGGLRDDPPRPRAEHRRGQGRPRGGRRLQGGQPSKDAFVAGAIGPTNKTLSMSRDVNDSAKRDVTFVQVRDAYREQLRRPRSTPARTSSSARRSSTRSVLKAALFADRRGLRGPRRSACR